MKLLAISAKSAIIERKNLRGETVIQHIDREVWDGKFSAEMTKAMLGRVGTPFDA